MKLKRVEAQGLIQSLNSLGNLTGPEFAEVVIDNIDIIQPFYNEFQSKGKEFEMTEDYKKFLEEKAALIIKHAQTDPEGKPIYYIDQKTQQRVYTLADEKAHAAEYETLKEKYKATLEEDEKMGKAFNEYMDAVIEIPIKNIPKSILPKDITVAQYNSIRSIIV